MEVFLLIVGVIIAIAVVNAIRRRGYSSLYHRPRRRAAGS